MSQDARELLTRLAGAEERIEKIERENFHLRFALRGAWAHLHSANKILKEAIGEQSSRKSPEGDRGTSDR